MRGGYRHGAGRKGKLTHQKKKARTIYIDDNLYDTINSLPLEDCNNFSQRCNQVLNEYLNNKNKFIQIEDDKSMEDKIRFIDLFAGIGGIRQGFEDENTKCVFSSEWDTFAQKTYSANFNELPTGDITQVETKDIPNHDVLLAGFPCQPFSSIGKREGFQNKTQGTLFFDVLRILQYHMPSAFLLENVPGLLTIQNGETFRVIIDELEKSGYHVFHTVLNAADFGLPQQRKRVIIVGFRSDVNCTKFTFPTGTENDVFIKDILEDDPKGYTISKKTQNNYLFKIDDGRPQIVDKNSEIKVKTLVASYHKIQRLTGTFVRGGETGIRLLSELECKRMMGFPDDFIIPVSRTQMYRQFGNSVAVPVIKAVADNIKDIVRTPQQLELLV